jgi:2-furoyl-CoA dehydrogenase large subunit
VPTATEIPEPIILHMETPSPFTPLGAKGVGEGNCMSTPVCIANAVADALGEKNIELPLVPSKIAALIHGEEVAAPKGTRRSPPHDAKAGARSLHGAGEARVNAAPAAVWAMLLDPNTQQAVIPGCHGVEKISDTHFRAEVTIGIGPVKGLYRAEVTLSDLDPPHALTLGGSAEGALGFGEGAGRITLTAEKDGGTLVDYNYNAAIGGKVASIGGRLLDGAARVIIGQFFAALARHAGGGGEEAGGWLARLRRLIGRRT